MKTMFIKSLCLILLSLAGLAASAQTFEVDGINYNVLSEEEGTVEVTSGRYSGNLVIPPIISYNGKDYAVTTIGEEAFSYCSTLTSVDMPSVTTIGGWAFSWCYNLSSVNMPAVTMIDDRAFYECRSLISVNMPMVMTIDNFAFSDCEALASVNMPSVTAIGENVFSYCALTLVDIPASCTSIGSNPFESCYSLQEIIVDDNNPNYTSLDGVLYDKYMNTLIACPGSRSSIDVPSSVTTISNDAFGGCSALTSVTMPSVTMIGDDAFSFCSALTSVTMPSVTTIGDDAFSFCSALISVDMPVVTTIGEKAFGFCDSLTSVSMPSVTTIGEYAFGSCDALTSVSMPSVITIGDEAFSCCSALTSVEMPSVTTIGDYAFNFCSSLTSISMPSVTTIGGVAFYYCSALTSVDIPASVSMIGNDAFSLCNALTSVYCHWEEPLECDPSFVDKVLENATLYVPTGTIEAYSSVYPWSEFANIEEGGYSGIADTPGSGLSVKVIDGVITVEGTDGTASAPVVEVYSAGGVCVYRGTDSSIGGLGHGIYVVRVGGTVQKVAL